ncbi:hypothetical protein D3C71_1817120 [compost metagenome]
MITGWPSSFCSWDWMLRIATSVPPPAGNGTTMVMARLGHSCAWASGVSMQTAVAAVPRQTAIACRRVNGERRLDTMAPRS